MASTSINAAQKAPERAQYVIEHTRGWSSLGLNEFWEYRELLFFFLWRDIKGKYRQMALGPLWIFIKPVISMVIFSIVFGEMVKVPSDNIPYPLFNYAALLPWNFFSTAVVTASGSLVGNMHLISKVYFPRILVPLSSALAGIFDMAVAFLVLLGLMVYYRVQITWTVLTLPLFLLLAILLALAVGLWAASTNVMFRDVGFAISFGLVLWQYLSPVVYSSSVVPEKWKFLYYLNPISGVIDGFRWALLGTPPPPVLPLAISSAFVVVALITGAFFFRRTERTVVDLL